MALFGVTLKKTGVATGKIFGTNNSVASLRGPGVCCAMVGDWLSTIRKLKRSVKSEGEMAGSATHIAAQSGGEIGGKSDSDIMKSYNLTVPTASAFAAPLNFSTVATLLSTQSGYVWIQLFGASSGHSVAANIQPGVYEFFDPNVGLHRFTSAAGFNAHVQSNLTAMYPTLNASGNYYVFGAL